jgi:hypothetical protein
MADATAYTIVSTTHINQWSDKLQTAVPGWEVKALWLATNTIIPVFVPDGNFSAENVDTLVMHEGAKIDAVHALGG